LVAEDGLAALRRLRVRDIFDLEIRLSDAQAQAEICKAMTVDQAAAQAMLDQLRQDPSFVRLKEVRSALALPLP
jgi:hypothetical protein